MKKLLLISAAVCVSCSALAETYTSASYAQRSHLVAQWDAINNAGTGTHDPNATVWKNLAGTGSEYT